MVGYKAARAMQLASGEKIGNYILVSNAAPRCAFRACLKTHFG